MPEPPAVEWVTRSLGKKEAGDPEEEVGRPLAEEVRDGHAMVLALGHLCFGKRPAEEEEAGRFAEEVR